MEKANYTVEDYLALYEYHLELTNQLPALAEEARGAGFTKVKIVEIVSRGRDWLAKHRIINALAAVHHVYLIDCIRLGTPLVEVADVDWDRLRNEVNDRYKDSSALVMMRSLAMYSVDLTASASDREALRHSRDIVGSLASAIGIFEREFHSPDSAAPEEVEGELPVEEMMRRSALAELLPGEEDQKRYIRMLNACRSYAALLSVIADMIRRKRASYAQMRELVNIRRLLPFVHPEFHPEADYVQRLVKRKLAYLDRD